MQVIGYLIVLALFGGQHKSFFDNVSNLSIDIQNVGKLFTKLFKGNITTDGPIFTEEDVRRANLVNKGTVAKYYSKALRDYIVYHNVSAEEEGFVVTVHNINKPPAVKDESDTKDEDKIPRVIFLPRRGVDVNDKTLNTVIAEYMDNIQDKIDSKEIGVVENTTRSNILPVDDKNKHLTAHPADRSQTAALEELNKSNDKDIKVVNASEETTTNIASNESFDINKVENVISGSDFNNTENNAYIDENQSVNNSTTAESSEGSVSEILNENELTDDIKEYDSNNFMSETSNEELNYDNETDTT